MKNRTKLMQYLKYIVTVVCILIVIAYIAASPDVSVEALLAHTPDDPIEAAAVWLLLYVVKSATVFFPLILLQIAVGHLFSPWAALGVNFAGMLIVLIVPYWIGRFAGMEAVEKQTRKYPKFREILDKQQDSSFFLCFFLRIISCLPGDVVTMYFGATRTSFWQNLFAGTLGILPGMILATLMGSSIQDPESPAFWISAALMITLAAVSILLYYLYRRRLRGKDADHLQSETGRQSK